MDIADKEALFAEIFRVLRPGGIIVAGDWMSSTDGAFSAAMIAYLELEGLGFGIGSPARYYSAMVQAGFRDIRMVDRNEWYRPLAHQEYDAVAGPLYDQLVARVGRAFLDHEIEVWRALTVVVDSGELRPGHLRPRKPLTRKTSACILETPAHDSKIHAVVRHRRVQSRFPLLVTEQLIYALEAIALSAQAAEPPLGLVRV